MGVVAGFCPLSGGDETRCGSTERGPTDRRPSCWGLVGCYRHVEAERRGGLERASCATNLVADAPALRRAFGAAGGATQTGFDGARRYRAHSRPRLSCRRAAGFKFIVAAARS